jgi:hypothetical protein
MNAFFRITKGKIILSLVIMILNISTAFYSANAVLCTEDCPDPNIFQSLFSPTIVPFSIFMFFGEFFEDITFLPEKAAEIFTFILSVIILLLFWYVIACLLIKLYSLSRKK